MGEYLHNAWSGWLGYTSAGKLAVLFLALTAYLVLGRGLKGPRARLVFYGGITAVLCILPVTAAILMKYQTLFYDYQWIWSLVPVTAVIALGGTVFLREQWKTGGGYRTFGRNVLLTLLCVGTLVLCSNPDGADKGVRASAQERAQAAAVLERAREVCGDDFCLWAPQEILEYVRELDGSVRLLYGRNMWDEALNAYSYDVYSEDIKALYLWMEHLRDYGAEISEAELREQVQKGFASGADCILLPEMGENYRGRLEELSGMAVDGGSLEIIGLDGYKLLRKG